MILRITKTEWWKNLRIIKHSTGRLKFDKSIASLLNQKLHAKQLLNCNLKLTHNWLKKHNSAKTQSAFWRGMFKCGTCEQLYTAEIKSFQIDNDDVEVCLEPTGHLKDNICNELKFCK